MSSHPQYFLQKAVWEHLSQDSNLAALVSGVFDQVPRATSLPYVVLGSMESRDWSSATSTGKECIFDLLVFSAQGGKKESAVILARLYALLHEAQLSLDAPHLLILLRFVSSDTGMEDRDGRYRARAGFRALIQSN